MVQIYEPFFEDFGPLNLGQAYRFCCRTNALRQVGVGATTTRFCGSSQVGLKLTQSWCTHQEAKQRQKTLYFYTGNSDQQRANAAVLVCHQDRGVVSRHLKVFLPDLKS